MNLNGVTTLRQSPIKLKLKLYCPHDVQKTFHQSTARFRVASFGRQSGKSTACVNELLKKAWENPDTKYWFISPTYEQARVQYRRMVGTLYPCRKIISKNNQSEMRVSFINGSSIRFVSGESLHNLRGETLHGVVIDEVREQYPELWPLVIRPMLTTTKGWCAFVSTPNGYDQFYDLAIQAMEDLSGDWEYFNAPSSCNPLFTKDEFDKLKLEMSEAQFAQEILAEFRDLTSGKAYINFRQANITMSNPFSVNREDINPNLPILVGLDFNVSPMSWILGQNRNDEFYFFDEIFMRDTNTQEATKALIEKVRHHKVGVILCGDATGRSRNTKATESDYAIICNALTAQGIKWVNRTPDSNPPVKDRVNLVNAKLKDANGNPHLWIHQRCTNLKKDFERVVWKDSQNNAILDQTGSNKDLTHISDAVGYAVYALSPINISGSVGTLKVIIR